MVDVDTGSRGAFLNSVPIGISREYLLPDGHGAWTVLSEDGTYRMAGTFPQHSLPVENDLPSLIAIGELVKSTENRRWKELDQIAPTVPDLGKRIQLTALEQAILRYLPYLEEACARPKAYLKTETARVYVSQARRIPARAIPYLAAHTEDWERPTLRSVRPKRVLAEVREDELDIYENRVAVRLVDRLLRVVQPRILELRKAQRILSDLLDYSTSAGGSHWRAGRICSLWAESISALQSEKRSRTTLEKLVSIRQRLRALLDSPLYRTISRRAEVPDGLKLTNILATDPIYKHIAILWLAWGRQKSGRQKSARDVFAEYRTFCGAFSSFCLLLVVRAFCRPAAVGDHVPDRPRRPRVIASAWPSSQSKKAASRITPYLTTSARPQRNSRRAGGKRLGVDPDANRLVERPDDVLGRGWFTPTLPPPSYRPAPAARWGSSAGGAPGVSRGDKPSEVADHAASQRDDHGVTVGPDSDQLIVKVGARSSDLLASPDGITDQGRHDPDLLDGGGETDLPSRRSRR